MTTKMLRYKYPMEYELTPAEIDKGTNWLTLKLKNISTETITDLDIQLHSRDTWNLTVHGVGLLGTGHYLNELRPRQEKKLVFSVTAFGSAYVYATIKARKDGDYFWWESGFTNIKLNEEKAEIGSLLVLSNPYTVIGKTISAEATLKGLKKSTELKLEFWVESPFKKSEMQAKIDIKDLAVGEEERYTVEFTPKETGYYRIYAYLYDGWRRIGYMTESIYARKQ